MTVKLSDAETDIGTVLLKMGLIDHDQLRAAVEKQTAEAPLETNGVRSAHLGQILVERGIITTSQRDKALAYQRDMRRGKGIDVMLDMLQFKTVHSL